MVLAVVVGWNGWALWIGQPNHVQFGSVVHVHDGDQHQHMHYVVRIEPEVETTREPLLRNPHGTDDSAGDGYRILLRQIRSNK